MGESAATGGGRRLVALFTPQFLAPSETFLYEQVRHYVRWEPEVFARTRLNADRFPETRVFTLLPGGPLRRAEAWLQRLTGHSPSFLRRLRERRHALLHAQYGRAGLMALGYRRRLGVPLLVTFRGRDVSIFAGRGRLPQPWLVRRRRELFGVAARILAVSRDLAERLVEIGAPRERVEVWHVGVRIPPVAPDPAPGPRPLNLLMAGRFVEKKGFEDGIEAFARLIATGVDARLAVIGDGERRAGYQARARLLGVAGRIDWPGFLPQAELLERITRSDVVIAPSVTAHDGDREGIPNVVKEAAARARPVVATRHGGIVEAVEDGVSGLLVKERDPEALAAALASLAADGDLRRRLGREGRRRMERDFDAARQVAALEDIYDRVLVERARP